MKNLQFISEHHILQLAAFAGKIILTSGAEVYRVEEIVSKVGQKFNLKVDCFATLTCIIASGKNGQGEIVSLVERINSRTTDLDKIHQINTLIKNIDKYSFCQLKSKLNEIEKIEEHPFKIKLFATALGGASFIVSFKGDENDFAVAFIAGAFSSIFQYLISGLKLNSFFVNLISSSICTFTACFFFKIGFISNPSISIISTLMLLVPGVAFINSIRDIIAGDLVAGTSRAMEMIMIGFAIAIGAGLILTLFLGNGGF
ncbi:threonine/serine exporter family protein [uncultured Cetobacterium sp.]|uniref:threonine/serine exporter family protein n=1 Tax=uncultured Cetobacterium sp. TaxID=527638 RepID=UPI00261F70B4|nr:threonine/serine exporter family protein [uncultured Cetobacterium sp.]